MRTKLHNALINLGIRIIHAGVCLKLRNAETTVRWSAVGESR